MGFIILGIFLMLYGLFCIVLGIFKIPAIWNMAKIQAFVKLMKDTGTRIFLIVFGAGVLVGGIFLVINNLPG